VQAGSRAARTAALPARTAALPARRDAGSAPRQRLAGGERVGWLTGLATRLFDGVAYVGLAVGAVALGWGDQIWPLALSVLALVAVRETMLACAGGALRADAEQDGMAR